MFVSVKVSSVLNAPIAAVWERIGDFNSLPDWFPSVIDSCIENGEPSDKIGCIRCYNREDGLTIREQLLGLDDQDYICTYALLEPDRPMEDYIGIIKLLPITDGDRTYIQWQADFKCLPEEESALRQNIEELFGLGFEALKRQQHPKIISSIKS